MSQTQQGRGSAKIVQVAVLVCLMLHLEYADAAIQTVGGSGGWTFNTDSWPNGKKFTAGDVLLFNYDLTLHNVVAVDKAGYSSCTTPSGAKVFKSGKDRIRLSRGQNYFICNFAGHCESGMKIAVNAA